jgi:hypothetical protein
MIQLELGGKIYPVKTLGSLLYNEYNILIDILESEEVDDFHKIKSVLKILTDIEKPEMISDVSLNNIDYEKLLEPPSEVKMEMIDLDSINFGKYVDLSYFEEDTIALTALMLGTYESIVELNKMKEEVLKSFPYEKILTASQYYYKWKMNLIKSYGTLFETDDEDEEDEEIEKEETNLMDIVRGLAGDDILKVNPILELKVREVFNWLSYIKEKNDKEKSKQQISTNYH